MKRALLAVALIPAVTGVVSAQRGRGNQSNPRNVDNTVYLSGKVVLPDGSPPPDLAAVERVCNGQVFPEGFTDPKGEFNVRLGSLSLGAMEDASMVGTDSRGRAMGDTLRIGGLSGDSERHSTMKNTGSVDLTGCDLRVQLDGFRADPILLGRRSTLDDPNVGTIILRPVADVTGDFVSATSAAAPASARKLYQRARKQMGKPNTDLKKAITDLQEAVAQYPDYAAAWSLLGRAWVRVGNETAAAEAYLRSMAADPRYLASYPPLIKLKMRSGDWIGTADLARRYLELNPSAAEERFYLALALQQTGAHDESLHALEALLSDESTAEQFPQARHVRGVILAERGQFAAAAQEWEQFLAAVPQSAPSDEVRRQIDEWKTLGVIE